MNAKHTPGPWTIKPVNTRPASFRIIDSAQDGNGSICEIAHIYSRSSAEQDARLIAAAPELLAACEYVINYHREHDSGEGELFGLDFVTTCIAAVRKANPD